jgi:gluconate 2-dehydrogenase gamma chain
MTMHREEGVPRAGLSRRALLRRAGAVGVVATVPAGVFAAEVASAPERERLETLTSAEAETAEAFVARLIPSDTTGPGAKEARVLRYIDRALSSELASSRPAYSAGLAATDAYARSRFGRGFAELSAAQQDSVLNDMERNVATGFSPNSRTFFDLVREHALQGMFGDPVHGGNADFIGWDLIGFAGVKLAFTEAEQQLDVTVRPAHKSLADYPLFAGAHGDEHNDGNHDGHHH